MDCVLVGTSLTRMTSTGHVVRDLRGPSTQVLPLGMAVMVSLLNREVSFAFFNLKRIFLKYCND